jgi:Xaa-Pro aminopeptidase
MARKPAPSKSPSRTARRRGPASTRAVASAASPPILDRIPAEAFAKRRRDLLGALGKAVGLVFAGDAVGEHPFRPHPHFEYLTGIADEPGAVLLLDPTGPIESRRATLFLRPLDPELERWDGLRQPIGGPLKARYGLESVLRLRMLPRALNASAASNRRLACLHPLANFEQPLSPDLAIFRKVAERMPGVEIVDRSDLLVSMRARKSSEEVAMIRRAAEATREGFLEAIAALRPGANEFEIESALDHGYRRSGSRRHAFSPIVGSGLNATVLHYHGNDAPIEPGELVLIDSGATWSGYASDVTRTYPADGVFTARQRELYGIVLAAQEAGIRACRVGKRLSEVDAAARKVIADAGYGEFFPHGTGHHLGLETHDATPDAPLAAGAVVTVEPGIYLPEERIGIRIEDDVLVTRGAPEILSPGIPKSIAEIERIMKRG